MYNSEDLEEEAEYALQYESDEIYQDMDMMILDECSLNLDNTQNFGDSQRLYDTLIWGECS